MIYRVYDFLKLENLHTYEGGKMKIEKVLVVEDDHEKIRRIVHVLEEMEIKEYFIARNADTAIKMAKSTKLDLLITDIVFPYSAEKQVSRGERTGIKMIKELADGNIKIPTIIYSFSPLSKSNLQELEKEEYPLLFQIMDSMVLKQILKKLLCETKESG